MEQENLNKLRQIMTAEQEAYRARLLEMPPAEILNHAWEYTAREDILMALDSWEPSKEKAAALLKSSSPLEDVVKEYRDQDVDNERIIDALDDAVNPDVDKERIIDALEELAKLHMEPPIYYNSIDYAIEHDEINAFYASSITYKDCKMAIDDAICRHFDGHHLGADCMEEVVNNFSPERVKNVLAYTVQSNEWDGRFSRDNKEWAKSVDTEHMGILAYQYVVNSHPAVLCGYTAMCAGVPVHLWAGGANHRVGGHELPAGRGIRQRKVGQSPVY